MTNKNDKTAVADFETTGGNVFADLEINGADELFTRTQLGIQVLKIIKERGYSQKDAGAVLNLKQPEVSAIMCAKFNRFSQERIIGFLNRLEQKVMIQVTPHKQGEPYQHVSFG